MIEKLYRPEWTCGRSHKTSDNKFAIMYNLLESNGHFFDEESAEFIELILNHPKGNYINQSLFYNKFSHYFSNDEIDDFFNILIDKGLLTQGKLPVETVLKLRQIAQKNRIDKEILIPKTVKEKLPFRQTTVETEYSEILEKDDIPFAVIIELTYNCNEKCIHCYNPGASRNAEEKSFRNKFPELKLEHYKKLFDELKNLGVVKIILTGGEPFIRKDVWQIIEILYKQDFLFEIYTNGLNLYDDCQKLSEYYPNSIGLSIYSGKEIIHDNITRTKGSFQKTLKVADTLSNLGVPLYFKCPIMCCNSNSYYLVEELSKKYGAISQFDISLTDSLDNDNSIFEQLQVKDTLLEIILRDPNIPLYVGEEAPNWGQKEIDESQPFCGAGINLVNITPEGYVSPCNSFPTQFGSIKEKSFTEIWKNSEPLKILKTSKIKDYYECGTHERCYYCNRCPGTSFIESGDFRKPSSNNCFIANARMELAKKLQKGIDPLKNKSIKENLSKFKIDKNLVVRSIKQESNYRNKEIF